MEPIVSIIVPVYRVENYLPKCIRSIEAQTYSSYEVILVDDGSPDACGAICDSYAERDPRVKVVHQSNRGLSAARNQGVRLAKGEFITFVDSDDYLEPDYLEYLVGLQQKYQSDIAVGSCEYLYEGKTPQLRREEEKEEVMDACEALIRMNYTRGFGVMACVKLYRRELILAHPFPEGQFYEDLAVLCKIVGDSRRLAFGSRIVYYWVQRPGSITRMEFDERQMAGIEAAAAQIEYVKARYPKALAAAKCRHTAKAVELIGISFASRDKRSMFPILRKHMNRYAGEVLKDKYAKKTLKLRIRAARWGYLPARIVFGAHERAKRGKGLWGGLLRHFSKRFLQYESAE